jgi:hypothetical protein
VWFRYDAPTTQLLRVTLTQTGNNASLTAFQGSPGSLTQLPCGNPETLQVTAGQTYYFMLVTVGPQTVTVGVEAAPPPPVLPETPLPLVLVVIGVTVLGLSLLITTRRQRRLTRH